jgi:zinc/manganese transport system substrate-binding protein
MVSTARTSTEVTTMTLTPRRLYAVIAIVLLSATALPAAAEPHDPLRVFTTVPDLAALAKRVGGPHVDVFSMVEGREDAHFAEPKPSFIKKLANADVYIEIGLELETAYAPVLLQNARNAAVVAGAPGHITAAEAAPDLIGPSGPITRARGDVHAGGDPHFLVDPVAALAVADRLRERFSAIAPAHAGDFAREYEAFRQQLLARLDGWTAQMAPYRGAKVVDDHAMWSYFARRFGIEIVGHLEPFPGIPPTTKHLAELVERMRAEQVGVIIASPYYDVRHAEKVAEATGAVVARLTHQTGGMPGTEDYLAMVDYNVRTMVEALERARRGKTP